MDKILVNLTEHPLRLLDGTIVEPSGSLIRLYPQYTGAVDADGLVFQATLKEPQLPPPQDGVLLVVTLPVMQLMWRERPDLVTPAFHHPASKRDETTKLVQVPGLMTFHKIENL